MQLETGNKVYTFAIKFALEIILLEVLCHYLANWCLVYSIGFEESAYS